MRTWPACTTATARCGRGLRDERRRQGAAVRDDQLRAFLGDARADAAVERRRRRHWLARQLDEDRTFDDVCVRALDDAYPVDVAVTSGRTHRGRLVAVDTGVLVVAGAGGVTAYVARPAVVGVRVRPPATAGDRTRGAVEVAGATIGDVVRGCAERGVRVELGTADGRVCRGRIDAVGRDVVRLSGGMHLRLDMVIEVITTA